MKKIAFISILLGLFSLSVPLESYAKTQTKEKVVQGKAKKKAQKKKTKKAYIRHATNVNNPQEGELLKLEGMVKDLNEQ